MNVIEAVRARRTIRQFEPRSVEKEKLDTLLEMATLAPNHRMTEPWRFYVLTGPSLESFAEEMSVDVRPKGEELVAKFKADLVPAPVTIAVTYCKSDSELQMREDYAATCAGVQNMLLAALELGLGGYWRTGRLVRDPLVRRTLPIPNEEEIVGFIYVGYPAEEGASRRTPWHELTAWL